MELLSLVHCAHALQKKECSSLELTKYFLKKIRLSDLNAFITVDEEYAQQQAQEADKKLSKGMSSMLTGVPMALKDLFCTTTMRTTCASKMLENFRSPYDATVTKRLAHHGAVLIGKTNMDEFAMGSTNEHSYFGAVKNPWNKQYVPGGSSGGSAAAVAAGLVPYSIGSDTGGSIRQPAAFCGLSGIKPTYGLVSRYGMVAYASSLDQGGPMAHSVEDLSIILEAIAGFDPKDSTSSASDTPNYYNGLNTPIHNLKIGLPACFFQPEIDEAIQKAVHTAVDVFKQLGAEIVEVDLKLHPLWVPCYYVIACAEASSNLSRYDGLRFGHQSTKNSSLSELITQSRSEGFGAEVKRRILTGTHVLSSGFYDAYYVQAQKIRRLIQDELLSTLKKVDIILGPTTPSCAWLLGKSNDSPIQSYLADVFTVPANLAGLPALSIPAGFNEGLPIGLQLMGGHFSEAQLLHIGHQFQLHTNWHRTTPDLG